VKRFSGEISEKISHFKYRKESECDIKLGTGNTVVGRAVGIAIGYGAVEST
jgi:hypothetical protein